MYKIYIDDKLFCDSRIDDLAIINPVVKLQVNSAGSFTFTVPTEHPKASLIKIRDGIVKVVEGSEILFAGIVVSESTNFYGVKTYSCEGELTYLNDSILRQHYYQNVTVRQLLEAYITEHNAQVDDSKKFYVGIVDRSDNCLRYTNYNSTLTEIKEDILDNFGGYIKVRYADGKRYLDYVSGYQRTSNQTVELGKNLLDYSSNIDDSDVATVIIPLGSTLETQEVEGLDAYTTIKSVNGGKDYLESEAVETLGRITKVVKFDDITLPSNLKTAGENYLESEQFSNAVLSINAVDFSKLSDSFNGYRLLDRIHVISERHGMDKWFVLTELTLNLNSPESNTITLGDSEYKSMSTKSADMNYKVNNAPTVDRMQSAINNASAMINGVNGGYVHIKSENGKPQEILITDTADLETAQKVWRWNQNGFGYSSTGYEGTYGTAITMDGSIVAEFINAGVMTGQTLKGAKILSTNRTSKEENVQGLYIGEDGFDYCWFMTGYGEAEYWMHLRLDSNGMQLFSENNGTSETLLSALPSMRIEGVNIGAHTYSKRFMGDSIYYQILEQYEE